MVLNTKGGSNAKNIANKHVNKTKSGLRLSENKNEIYGLGKIRTLQSFYSNATILPNVYNTNTNTNIYNLYILITFLVLLFIIIFFIIIA